MNDFIPTTAEVRDAYSSESSDSKFANRAFDLWLARYKAKIIAQTEQRIIKRLDSGEFTTEVFEWFTQHIPHTEPLSESAVEDLSERLITLIKGESQKDNEIVILSPKRVGGNKHVSHCNDYGCHGCWDCDCEDCLEGENK